MRTHRTKIHRVFYRLQRARDEMTRASATYRRAYQSTMSEEVLETYGHQVDLKIYWFHAWARSMANFKYTKNDEGKVVQRCKLVCGNVCNGGCVSEEVA